MEEYKSTADTHGWKHAYNTLEEYFIENRNLCAEIESMSSTSPAAFESTVSAFCQRVYAIDRWLAKLAELDFPPPRSISYVENVFQVEWTNVLLQMDEEGVSIQAPNACVNVNVCLNPALVANMITLLYVDKSKAVPRVMLKIPENK